MKIIENLNLQVALSSILEASKKTIQFAKFIDSNGFEIKGLSTTRGYENQIIVLNSSFSFDEKDVLLIAIPNTSAVNGLMLARNSKNSLKSGEISVLSIDENSNNVLYKIFCERTKVNTIVIIENIAIIELIPEKSRFVYSAPAK